MSAGVEPLTSRLATGSGIGRIAEVCEEVIGVIGAATNGAADIPVVGTIVVTGVALIGVGDEPVAALSVEEAVISETTVEAATSFVTTGGAL